MWDLVEPLETRRLLTASAGQVGADGAIATAEMKVINADLTALGKRVAADVTILKTATKSSTAANKALVKTLAADEKSTIAAVTRDTKSFESLIKRDGLAIFADVKKVDAKPTNVKLQEKLTAAIAKFNADSAGKQTLLTNEAATVNTKADADLNLISAALPSTQPAVTTAAANVAAGTGTVQGDFSTLFRELNTFITAASA